MYGDTDMGRVHSFSIELVDTLSWMRYNLYYHISFF